MTRFVLPLSFMGFALCACGGSPDESATPEGAGVPPPAVVQPATEAPVAGGTATLMSTQGNQATGVLTFAAEQDRVRVQGQLSGLTPNGEHGFHVHERGDCSAPDAESAGDHFNPTSQPHGSPTTGPHHAGDMMNVRADGDGNATIDFRLEALTLGDGGATDVLGKAVIVHADPDDYTSQPSGNTGARVACGVVQ